VSTEKAPNDLQLEEKKKIINNMTETAPANLDLKRPPSRPQRPRNASDASDFQLFETASMASMASSSMGGGGDQQSYSPPHSPPLLASSYEAANRKRLRSGSVSGRLRSASEYLEEKGLLDRQTKGIMKDLIIIGDEELQAAIDRYENGDPSVLEEMIQSGALQNRLPKDLDILGDLDLDFLTMDESALLPPPQMMMNMMAPSSSSMSMIMDGNSSSSHDETAAHQLQQLQHSSCMISPDDDDDDDDQEDDDEDDEEQDEDDFDDDIGELDFHSDHDFDQPHDRIASDSPTPELSDHERRMRSNSLYSALINNNPSGNGGGGNNSAMESTSTYGRWMDPDQSSRRNRHHATMETTILPAVPAFSASSTSASTGTIATRSSTKHSKNKDDDDKHKGPIQIQGKKKGRRPKTASDIQESNLTKSLRDHADKNKKKKQAKQAGKLEKQQQQQQQEQQQQQKAPRKPRKPKQQQQQQEPPDDTAMETTSTTPTMEEPVHILGRPRSWSDPQLSVTLDEDGLRNVERPDGWVGAYSPDSRKERIKQFLTKRNLRVWTKSVKYNVRKDFANSRLRVKGRFVKKEDETLMRELMSLT
jgi:CCT motif